MIRLNNTWSYLPFALLIILFASCEKDAVEPQVEKAITFEGLKARMPQNYNENILSLSLEDLKSQYTSLKGSTNSKSSAEEIDVSMDEMASIISEIMKKYPDTDELTATDVARVQEDFNGISKQEIHENIDAITDFYDAVLRYELVNALADFQPQRNSGARTSDYFGYDISAAEAWALIWHPRLIKPTRDATEKAKAFTSEYFPGQGAWRTKADAFRHGIWNALLAKYVGDKKNKISKCTDWAKTFTDKHEEAAVKMPDVTDAEFRLDKDMDYHNNKIGRDYFSSVAWVDKRKWYQTAVVKSPSDDTMADAIFARTNSARKVTTKAQMDSFPNNLVYLF